jgi:hypothetical protein
MKPAVPTSNASDTSARQLSLPLEVQRSQRTKPTPTLDDVAKETYELIKRGDHAEP